MIFPFILVWYCKKKRRGKLSKELNLKTVKLFKSGNLPWSTTGIIETYISGAEAIPLLNIISA
jgi:hypothetical protein